MSGASELLGIWEIVLEIPDKLAVAEHSINWGYRNQLHKTNLSAIHIHMDRIIRDTTETELQTNMYEEGAWLLSHEASHMLH
jgi:hypothetical protein